jgi:hypothetical protein
MRLLDLQPRLRSIFFVELALLQYRMTMQPQAIDTSVFEAQRHWTNTQAPRLEDLLMHFDRVRCPTLQKG